MIALDLIVALGAFALGAFVDVAVGAQSRLRAAPYGSALVGSAFALAAGVLALAHGGHSYSLGSLFGLGRTSIVVDHLSALFLTLIFSVALAVSLYAISWTRFLSPSARRGTGLGFCLVLAATLGVVVAGDDFTLLFAWEILTGAFYVLAGARRTHLDQARAAWLTVATGKVSGAALLLGVLLLAGHTGHFSLDSWRLVGGGVHDAAYALLVVAFAAKLGVTPFQGWVPRGYRAAAGPARALMAGVAVNVGVYGLWRTTSLLGRPPVLLVVIVLLTGGTTALLGIAFAGVQTSLTRVVAYSSVENAGLIVTAYGVALAGEVAHLASLVAVGFLAATLQTVAHAVAKSGLFVATTTFHGATGTDDLELLRGVGRARPVAGVTFALGAMALAGLPPTIGFVSEWFILEALMQEFRLPGLALRLALAGAGALVALTSGLAALAFVRVIGFVVLGPRRLGSAVTPHRPLGGLAAGALGASCLWVAAVTPLEIRVLARGLAPIVAPRLTLIALRSPWVLQPAFAGFSILSPSWLFIALPVLVLAVTGAAVALSRGRYFRVRRVPPWTSATSGVRGHTSYTAFGFANPLRHVLANVLGTERRAHPLESRSDLVRGRGPVEYATSVVEPVERFIYTPLRRGVLALAAGARRLQSGRLEAYVAYMLAALVAVLAVVAGLH